MSFYNQNFQARIFEHMDTMFLTNIDRYPNLSSIYTEYLIFKNDQLIRNFDNGNLQNIQNIFKDIGTKFDELPAEFSPPEFFMDKYYEYLAYQMGGIYDKSLLRKTTICSKTVVDGD